MDEYIRRKVLIDAIDKMDWYHVNVQGRITLGAAHEDEALYKATDIYNAIYKPPVVDVGEVVRCRDCKHWSEHGYKFCKIHSVLPDEYGSGVNVYTENDDFCSYGERRCEDGTK